MTDLAKIKKYYQNFNEWERLDSYPGQLELIIVLKIIEKYLPPPAKIFDLGGGAGRYTYELAKKGYTLDLADLSPDLIKIARTKLKKFMKEGSVRSIQVANALNLSDFADDYFENMLLFGPLYHLTKEDELKKCLSECYRVMRPKGKIFASYIPYHGGLTGILERSIYNPHQVGSKELKKVFKEGIFQNRSESGFQEGKHLKTADLKNHFQKAGFKQLEIRSIRSIGYKYEKDILTLREKNPDYYATIMNIIHGSATELPYIETCGHAVYIGEKSNLTK